MGRVGTALRELRGAQKSAKGVSLYSRFVNRPAGRYLAAGSYGLGLTPNQVTLVSAAFSFAAAAAVALTEPSWGLGIAVWAALAVGFAFDSADGQLARLRGGGSAAGEWLDHVVDCAKLTAVHSCVLIAFYRFPDSYGIGGAGTGGDGWLLVPLGFQFAAIVTFFGGLLTEKLKPRPAWESRRRAVDRARGGVAARGLRGVLPGVPAARRRAVPMGVRGARGGRRTVPAGVPHQVVPGAQRRSAVTGSVRGSASASSARRSWVLEVWTV